MVLPRYLAMTAAEIIGIPNPSFPFAYMACQFSPYTEGLANVPDFLPQGSILMLNDRMPCQGHSADLVVNQLQQAVDRCGCESVLLDFQRPPEPESLWIVKQITTCLSCPVAVTEGFATDLSCPVVLLPAPLHIPLQNYLLPWQGREIWLEAALCQEEISVTQKGSRFLQRFPTDGLTDGHFDEQLCCNYKTVVEDNCVTFTLFDTHESLEKKLNLAGELGVVRTVGLYQELGTFLTGNRPDVPSIAESE